MVNCYKLPVYRLLYQENFSSFNFPQFSWKYIEWPPFHVLYTPTPPLLKSVFFFVILRISFWQVFCPQFSVCVSVISYKHKYHDYSVVFIVARGVYLLVALKMMRRNVCFLNYQMLKERGNSRDKYGT